MKPLIVLLVSFLISLGITKLFIGKFQYMTSGRIAFACMFVFTAIGHFVFTHGMTKMIPEWIPEKTFWVIGTGVLEILFAIGILIPSLQKQTGIVIILFLILLLPANIKATFLELNYQTGELNGSGVRYLWFRIPLQLFFIAWVFVFTIKKIPSF